MVVPEAADKRPTQRRSYANRNLHRHLHRNSTREAWHARTVLAAVLDVAALERYLGQRNDGVVISTEGTPHYDTRAVSQRRSVYSRKYVGGKHT